jgi:parvulin-like peptidyl-prolyl isomerase
VGGVTRVVRSNQGFHLFKLLGRTEARVASYDEAKETLRRWLEQRELETRYRAYLADLRKKFHVDIKA